MSIILRIKNNGILLFPFWYIIFVPRGVSFFLDISHPIPHNQTQVYAVRRIKGGTNYRVSKKHLRTETGTVRRTYKDTVFSQKIFNNKENLLALYNALNGTHYNNPEDIEI